MEIIWGIQFDELIRIIKQVGLAIMGAAALWGYVFSVLDKKHKHGNQYILDDWISIQLFYLFVFGLGIALFGHFVSYPALTALAHEGISIKALPTEILATYTFTSIVLLLILLGTTCMFFYRKKSEHEFSHTLTPFFAIMFLTTFALISFSAWRGQIDKDQIFHFIHGFHSIFTLGSVIVLDFLFLISSRSELLKQHICALFPTISKVIWTGLSLDFISVFLIPEAFVVTEKLIFTQTVITILIINGVFLSGPIARHMMTAVKLGGRPEKWWRSVGNVAGAISITSWFTITALDYLRSLTLGYGQMLALYLSCFLCAFIGHIVFEAWEKRQRPPQGVHD